ncbi:MAG: hypothetical protein RLZZ324_97, partial [Candidatus Parcubacteria bacterium]
GFFASVMLFMVITGAALAWHQSAARRGIVRIGDDVAVRVEIANTDALREHGLSGHKPLAADEGMFFVFEAPDRYVFWMKEMLFPLDLIWIGDGKIVDITPDVPAPAPGQKDLPLYRPVAPADRVLEVNAGFARAHGLKLGMPVELGR